MDPVRIRIRNTALWLEVELPELNSFYPLFEPSTKNSFYRYYKKKGERCTDLTNFKDLHFNIYKQFGNIIIFHEQICTILKRERLKNQMWFMHI